MNFAPISSSFLRLNTAGSPAATAFSPSLFFFFFFSPWHFCCESHGVVIGCKVAKRVIVMDRLQRTDREGSQIKRGTKIGTITSWPQVTGAKSDDLTKTNQDIVLNLSLFFVFHASRRSVAWLSSLPFLGGLVSAGTTSTIHRLIRKNCWVVHRNSVGSQWEIFF